LVPGTGIEPALPCDNQILSLTRLPIPPSGLMIEILPAYLLTIKDLQSVIRPAKGMQYYGIENSRPKCKEIFLLEGTALFTAALFR
jgi:hypothetical protein